MTAPVTNGYVQDNAASVRGIAARITRLGSDGAPSVGSTCDIYVTSGFVNFTFTPNYSEGEEISITNASGMVCVYYKSPDTLQNVTVGLELCDPDPVLTQLLVGGEVLTAAGNDACAPLGSAPTDVVAVGYASSLLGQEGGGYGVSIEVWAQAVVGGKAATTCPYWRYLIPYSTFRLDGDRVVENGNLATVFTGTGGGNASFGPGPNMDLTGVTPAPAMGAFDWPFPTYTDRPFLYARDMNAPVGLNGCFTNKGIAIITVIPGIPATLVPANASRPADLEALILLGDLGQTDPWTPGQSLELLDGTSAYWDGTTWVAGRAPSPIIPATSANAGTPGTYSPAGATMPANLAALQSVTAVPTTPWLQGQYVNLADLSTAYWNGTTYVIGAAPAPINATGATAGTPGSFTPTNALAPADLAGMTGLTANPATPWTTGQYVVPRDNSNAYWDGTAWAEGTAALVDADTADAGEPGSFDQPDQ